VKNNLNVFCPGFADKYIPSKFSHHKQGLSFQVKPSLPSSVSTHINLDVALAIALYSTSVLDLGSLFLRTL
jgi:hypothetical protein